MTVIQDIKPLSGCTSTINTNDCSTGGLGINCCSTTASSVMSIDQTSSTSLAAANAAGRCQTDFKNNLSCKYDNIAKTFSRCNQVNIEFEDIKYAVKRFSFAEKKFVKKEILHGISGAFRSGELTAIMGPSGSGKSTLLNVMTGFRCTGVTGTIRVNGKAVSTNSQKFRELSCYIHQDDLLRPQLTVGETMMLAAHLKLGYTISLKQKQTLVKEILALLGMDHRYNVFAAKLSGGQKKRLAIALELITKPAVLYLDEPTTGLDSSSCSQCIGLLKKLTSLGHTIICTIHQPSALVFEMFDKLYTVVDGHCMYQGPINDLVPFLAEQNLMCPSYHNPADYLLEVAVGEHERDLEKLIDSASKKYNEDCDLNQLSRVTRMITKIQAESGDLSNCYLNNGNKLPKNCNNDIVEIKTQFPTFDYVKPVMQDMAMEELKTLNGKSNTATLRNGKTVDINQIVNDTHEQTSQLASHHNDNDNNDDLMKVDGDEETNFVIGKYSQASFFRQYLLLLKRILVCTQRNYFLVCARLLSHFVIGIIFGYLYIDVGTKATTVLGNYVYLYGTVLLLVYTGKMAVVLTFPLEIGMLTREHFNRWYNLGPYFLSMLTFEIPFQCICAGLYISISIYLTQKTFDEMFRLYYFLMFASLVTLSAQAWGFFVGATMPTKIAVFIGPILAVLFSVFGLFTRYIDITPFFRWMWHISYFRAGFHGILNTIYGMDRHNLPCPDNVLYCHFRSPKVFLDFVMVSDVSISNCILLMVGVIGVMHVMTACVLWYKLNRR